ncbi:hypothetical protein ACLOJK_016250 [Asimina triloba]
MRAAMVNSKDPISSEGFSEQESTGLSSKDEILSIKAELEKIKATLLELQRDHAELLLEFDKVSKQKTAHGHGWSTRWKKIKNSSIFFYAKIDSDEKGQTHHKKKSPSTQQRRASVS